MNDLIRTLKEDGKIIVRDELLYQAVAKKLLEEGISYNAFDLSEERIMIELDNGEGE